MKLLFDHNLSKALCTHLNDVFPDSSHVRSVGLERGDDDDVWEFARAHGFAIASKDDDFRERSYLHGHPPKVVWIRIGNCSTAEIAKTLRRFAPDIQAFGDDPEAAICILTRTAFAFTAVSSLDPDV